jgi:nucleotide-binding universal stress UspA family protein
MVAVSSPWASEKLFQTVHDLARRLKASIVVAHVAQQQEEDDGPDDMRRRAQQTLEALTNRLAERKITSEGVLLVGDDVGRAILNAAKAQNCTLLVLGASGKGRMARLLAGDIPQQIIRSAEMPVLVFPADWSGLI